MDTDHSIDMIGPDGQEWTRTKRYEASRVEIKQLREDNDALRQRVSDLGVELRAARAEVERLKTEGTPGVLHKVDAAFLQLAITERDSANEWVKILRSENTRLRAFAPNLFNPNLPTHAEVLQQERDKARAEVERLRRQCDEAVTLLRDSEVLVLSGGEWWKTRKQFLAEIDKEAKL